MHGKSSKEPALLSRVNHERVSRNLPPLCLNSKLQAATRRHVMDQATSDFMSDIGTDDSTSETRAADAGFQWENLAESIDSEIRNADDVVNWWMKNADRENILGNFTMTGIAYVYNPDLASKDYWVELFATGIDETCDA
ncbi:hypothetical protein PsorP6_003146 [Peronosclerospora sorghi]|uniref:Uncharacterized protein n=1 Tax=Peronosclerospora sorghi TaxID=230839 RepID=A0ACC0VLR3_9STRA|nr:hypothetical protein PsorP6_003146 [Peronosclerospora sorghi]